MKVKKIVFTKVKTGYANQGDYYTNIDGVEIVKWCLDCGSASIHDIYTREVIEEEWRPEANCGYYYYTPRINSAGVASFQEWVDGVGNNIEDASLIFPTAKLAMAKAQEWINAEIAK